MEILLCSGQFFAKITSPGVFPTKSTIAVDETMILDTATI